MAPRVSGNFCCSPWNIIGPRVILITPYVVAALWIGQLVAFIYHAAANPVRGRLRRTQKVNPLARYTILAMCGLILFTAGFLNMREATPAKGKPLVELSRDILDGVSDHKYLLSDGSLDAIMQWEAYKKGQDIRIINPSKVGSAAYRTFCLCKRLGGGWGSNHSLYLLVKIIAYVAAF